MTIPKLGQHHLNMISAWIGAVATLAVLIVHPPNAINHPALPLVLAAIAITVFIAIIRLKPTQDATLALSGTLGATFTALSYCLIQ